MKTGVAAPEVLDGLADACWWCGDVAETITARERAVGRWRACGDLDRAVRGAVWIAIEYADALGHDAASSGWLARATTMAEGAAAVSASGWVALGRAALAGDPSDQAWSAQRALEVAREAGDTELEVLSLARLGWARVASGAVDAGIAVLDEAMATATAADLEHPNALGDLCCQLARATEASESGDVSPAGWRSCGGSTPSTATRPLPRCSVAHAPRARPRRPPRSSGHSATW